MKCCLLFRGHQQHVDSGALAGSAELLDGFNAVIHQLSSSLASQPQQQSQDIPHHNTAGDLTNTDNHQRRHS